MEKSGTRPDNLTFPFLLRACTKLSSLITRAQFHTKIVKFGLWSNVFIRNALINLHANCGDALFDQCARRDIVAWSAMIAGYARRGKMAIARKLFDESPSKDLVSRNVMITAYAKREEMGKARELFDRVPEKDVMSWNALIAGHLQCGSHSQALEVFDQMRYFGEQPDEITMLSLLSARADSGALDVGRRSHSSLSEKCSRTGMPVVLGNALIDLYAKCGKIVGGFGRLREKLLSKENEKLVNYSNITLRI